MLLSSRHLRKSTSTAAIFAVIILIYWFCFHEPITKSPVPLPSSPLQQIPRNIWQLYFGYSPLGDLGTSVMTWISMNQDFQYVLMSAEGGNAFAQKHYSDQPKILQTFLDLQFPIFRSDLLRYMLLEAEGGVYSDLDTTAQKPIIEWIPKDLQAKVRAIVGIEYDQRDDEPYFGMSATRLQFCQWTMAASQGHPMMKNIVIQVVDAIHNMAEGNNTTIGNLQPVDEEVLPVTGPAIWSRVVLEALSTATGTNVTYLNLTGLHEPRLFGDILILPIDGFGSGQPHSGSSRDGTDQAFVTHQFKGSWKHGWSN